MEDPDPPPTPRVLFQPKQERRFEEETIGDEFSKIPLENWNSLVQDFDHESFQLVAVDWEEIAVPVSGEMDYLFSPALKPYVIYRQNHGIMRGIDQLNYLTNGKIRQLISASGREIRKHSKIPTKIKHADGTEEEIKPVKFDKVYDSLLALQLSGDEVKGQFDEFAKSWIGHTKYKLTELEGGRITVQATISTDNESPPILVNVEPRLEVVYYTLEQLTAMAKCFSAAKITQRLPLTDNPYFKATLQRARRNLNMDAVAGPSALMYTDDTQEFIDSQIPPPLQFISENPIERAIRLAKEKEKVRKAKKLRSNHTVPEVEFSEDNKKEKDKLKNKFKINNFLKTKKDSTAKPEPSKPPVKRSSISNSLPTPPSPKKVRKEENMTKRKDLSSPKTNKEITTSKKSFVSPQIIPKTPTKRANTEEFNGNNSNKKPKITITTTPPTRTPIKDHGQRETPRRFVKEEIIPNRPKKFTEAPRRFVNGEIIPNEPKKFPETPRKFVNGDIIPNGPKNLPESPRKFVNKDVIPNGPNKFPPKSQPIRPKIPDEILAIYSGTYQLKFNPFKTNSKLGAENENKTAVEEAVENNPTSIMSIFKTCKIKPTYLNRGSIKSNMAKDTNVPRTSFTRPGPKETDKFQSIIDSDILPKRGVSENSGENLQILQNGEAQGQDQEYASFDDDVIDLGDFGDYFK